MAEFVFPEIKTHYATINGWNLIFSPRYTSALHVNKAQFDFVRNCSGLTIDESRIWLRERYGESSVGMAYSFQNIVERGFFSEPRLDFAESESSLPPVTSFGIGTTHRCNMQCRYCFAAGMRGEGRQDDISSETAHAALDFLFDVLKPPFARIELGITGEPQLRWDAIEDITDYAEKRAAKSLVEVSFHITTNGLETSPDMVAYLRAHDDMDVTLSWDGPPHIHNYQRLSFDGTPTHDRVSNTFEILRSTMRSRPSVVAVVSALNPDIRGIFTHLFEKGVRDLIIKPLRSTDPAMAVTDGSLPAFKTGYADLAELLLKNDHIQIERLFTILKADDFLGRFILRLIQGQRLTFRCMAARTYLEVDTNGEIYPCPSLVGMSDFRLGNVYTGLDEDSILSFHERTFLGNQQSCRNCWAKFYCGGPCAYFSAINTGKLGTPYLPDCELNKYLIELAGYIVARLNTERPGLLSHVMALRNVAPMGRRPEASCFRAPQGGLWTRPMKEWRVPEPIVLAGREHADGSKQMPVLSECSAQIHLRWDDEFLYLMAEVRDPVFTPPVSPESQWWFRDSIQFALDPEKDGGEDKYPWKLPQGDCEFGVALANGRAYIYDCQLNPLRPVTYGTASIIREGGMTTYRVATPWSRIPDVVPSVGAECRFSVVVNDCDCGNRRWLQWTHGLATRKAPARFGLLRLVE